MRRLSRPQSSDSPPRPSSQWGLSPVLHVVPDQAARTSHDSATPSVLYRSCFAQECEAVVFQLSNNTAESVRPRCPLTIQEETLTPLEPPCSFLDSSYGRSPPRPVPETASDSAGPPDPFATVVLCSEQSQLKPLCSFLDSSYGRSPARPVPEAASASAGPLDPFATVVLCSEQSAGLAGISPGVVAQLAASPPASNLAGESPWPEREKASPPPSGTNVTYECCSDSGSSANATYVCTGAPSPEEKGAPADTTSVQPALGVCKRELPFITSTPLAPSLSKEASPTTLCTECPRKPVASGSDSKQKPPADLQQESESRVAFVSSHRNLPAAASSGADRVPGVSGKTPFVKNSLSLVAPRALRTRGAPGLGGLFKGTGTTKKIPQPVGGNSSWNFVRPPTRSGSALKSQPVTQKLLSDETTKTDLMELSCNKKPPISMQPSSKLVSRFGVQGSLACLGLKSHGTPRDNNASGTRLPVFAGNKVTAKTSSQKRPWEKTSDKATSSPLKQPFPKRSRLCKSQKEKHTLTAVGQTPSATLEKELIAPCLQCQWLAEENQQLKSMLETCQKTIAFLEGKGAASLSGEFKPLAEWSLSTVEAPGWALEDVQRMELKSS